MPQNKNIYKKAMREGLAANLEQNHQHALKAFRIAIREFPQEAAPYAGLGEACFGLKQLGRALECYKLAARHSGGAIRYLERVADIEERLGQLHSAAQTYMAAGEFMLRGKRLDNAISNWERAVRLQPNLLGAHQRLAMVFQRKNDTRRAVREYLAIARILQMQGQQEKALRMCQAALRLDPGNEDVLTAIELVQFGEEAFDEDEVADNIPELLFEEEVSMADTVRQMAAKFEQERNAKNQPDASPAKADSVAVARRLAQEQLAEEIFREEEDENLLYGTEQGEMSKLERDALIGQGIDFQSRDKLSDAIACYEKAVVGGLMLPAALFTLGVLYFDSKNKLRADHYLAQAANHPDYELACGQLRSQIH